MASQIIKECDLQLYELICEEEKRQRSTLDMIASESLQDAASLALSGSAFGNKTAVGLPGRQRLGGSGPADALERLAAERAYELFGAEHANILPYSGTTANLCVYDAILKPGDTVLALDPEQGSHASHGRKEHISAKLYHFVHFGVDPQTQLLDYEEVERLLQQHRPKLLVIGVSAYARLIDYQRLAEMAHRVGTVLMADIAHTSGLVAAKVLPSPLPHADIVTASATKTMCGCHTGFILCSKEYAQRVDAGVYPGVTASLHLQTIAAAAWAFKKAAAEEFQVLMQQVVKNAKALAQALMTRGFGILTGGTDCHMMVMDLRPLHEESLDAVSYCDRLEGIGISVNTKRIPYDTAEKINGIRLGCTILTQRGMKEADMEEIADIFWMALQKEEAILAECRKKVQMLCDRFPVC